MALDQEPHEKRSGAVVGEHLQLLAAADGRVTPTWTWRGNGSATCWIDS